MRACWNMYCALDFCKELSAKYITPFPTMIPCRLMYLVLFLLFWSMMSVAKSGMYLPA